VRIRPRVENCPLRGPPLPRGLPSVCENWITSNPIPRIISRHKETYIKSGKETGGWELCKRALSDRSSVRPKDAKQVRTFDYIGGVARRGTARLFSKGGAWLEKMNSAVFFGRRGGGAQSSEPVVC